MAATVDIIADRGTPSHGGAAGSGCHPSYEGACLPVGQGDVDCSRSANGPNYTDATNIKIVGPDEFGLDNDHDGFGCDA
jgi:hypothetical protein